MRKAARGDVVLTVGRSRLAAFVLGFLRPKKCERATLHSNYLSLVFLSNTLRISFDQIENIGLGKDRLGHTVKLQLTDSDKAISGLSQRQAKHLKEGLEAARVYWWQKALNEFQSEIQDVYDAVSCLKNPRENTRLSTMSHLTSKANKLLKKFPKSCPDLIANSKEFRNLKEIKELVRDPEGHRRRANTAFATKDTVKLQPTDSDKAISGLSQSQAKALKERLEAASVYRWRKALNEFQSEIQDVYVEVSSLKDSGEYARSSTMLRLTSKAKKLLKKFPKSYPDLIANLKDIKNLKEIKKLVSDPEGHRHRANAAFVTKELSDSKQLFDTIESDPLTNEQRKAVVVDEDHNLVVAAAGSGKTSVIVAKAGWLVKRGFHNPSKILLLAYAKNAQKEMEERIRDRLGDEISDKLPVSTFHGLGLSIIGEAWGKKPSLSKDAENDRALRALLKRFVAELIQDRKYSSLMVTWFQNHFAPYRSETEFKNQGEYWNYIRANDILSLKGEKVKSFEECEIANFLFRNGINYEYESPYKHDTATAQRMQYRPDFYLTDYGIYIEHFALSASGDTPPFIDRKDYHRSRQWKLKLHAKHGTPLIETFSHEKSAGVLTKNLSAKLDAMGVKKNPIPPTNVFAILEKQGRVDPFTQLLATFLQHFKGSQLSIHTITERAMNLSDGFRTAAFVKIFEPVFERYEKWLSDQKQIDFNDMINKATALVEEGAYQSPYDYILVDEFQDISSGRAKLLGALLENSQDSQLFAVGDDWQAIYRFAGSDIAIMREFQERFGATEHIDLSTTFRCSEPITTAATKFVLENPTQLRKKISSTRKAPPPCISIGLPSSKGNNLLEKALKYIKKIHQKTSKSSKRPTVLVLGRYKPSRYKPSRYKPSRYKPSRTEELNSLAKDYPSLDIKYKTIHKSKGLEADFVVLIGLSSGKYGFPTEMTDDPILDIVLAQPEGYPNAEERRLFYVALTRARHHVFLIADDGPPSPFVMEMLSGKYHVNVFGRRTKKDVNCPTCVEGIMKRRKGPRDTFYGCSNFPYCNFTLAACHNCSSGLPIKSNGKFICSECGQHAEGCPKCDGRLQKRSGKNGEFLGCSNYPSCRYTKEIYN